jgi:hypothetical protein
MSNPSWDIKYLEDVERRLRRLEAKIEEIEKRVDAFEKDRITEPVKNPEPSPAKRKK